MGKSSYAPLFNNNPIGRNEDVKKTLALLATLGLFLGLVGAAIADEVIFFEIDRCVSVAESSKQVAVGPSVVLPYHVTATIDANGNVAYAEDVEPTLGVDGEVGGYVTGSGTSMAMTGGIFQGLRCFVQASGVDTTLLSVHNVLADPAGLGFNSDDPTLQTWKAPFRDPVLDLTGTVKTSGYLTGQ